MRRVLAAAALVALLAAAALAPAAVKPPRYPPTGKYAITSDAGATAGSFKVAKKARKKRKKVLKALRVSPEPVKVATCGTKIRTKRRTLKLSVATRGGFSIRMVGRNTPNKTSDGITPIPVTYVVNGFEIPGTFKLAFDYRNDRKGDMEIRFGGCELFYFFNKRKR
jgi:opacity protein-like surface antigen